MHFCKAWSAIFAFAALLSLSSFLGAQQTTSTADIVRAANTFLTKLSTEQRPKVLYTFDNAAQRVRWSNFPTGFVPRGGISLKQMSAPQRDATMKLLATVLSPMGLEKVNEIREADEDFKANGSERGPGGRRAGPPPGGGPPSGPGLRGQSGPPNSNSDDMFGSSLYYISFLGSPSTTQPWML